ncbi:MAG: hypothetical protein AAF488_14265 [Planctomycetota bacterium]
MRRQLAIIFFGLASITTAAYGLADNDIPPLFVEPGSYVSKKPDGTHPYGESHGVVIGVDVEFSHYDGCDEVYITKPWMRPIGGGAKQPNGEQGEIRYDHCEKPGYATLYSASIEGLTGDLTPNDDGSYTADYSGNGGNERVWHPE